MVNTIISLWYVWLAILAVGFVCGFYAYNFLRKPTSEQIKNVKNWLVLMCVKAEKELGSGTGQLKLRLVYDWFINKFPAIANIVSFEIFSGWVDDALEEARHIMEENPTVKAYVNGEE